MPTAIRTIVVEAKCDVCGAIYEGENALARAARCERQSMPNFAIPLGTQFKERQPSGFVSTYTVVKMLTGHYSHQPCYSLRTQSGGGTILNERVLARKISNSIV